MDWKTLLDGVIGGVTGGVIGGVSAYAATGRQIEAQTSAAEAERLELRRDRSRAAASLLLTRLADLESVVPILPVTARDSYVMSSSLASGRGMARLPSGAETVESIRRSLVTELPLVNDELITRHYRQLIDLALYFHTAKLSAPEVSRGELELTRYLRWVQMFIVAYVSERPTPPDVTPPVRGRILDALKDWEPDPKPDGWE